MSAPNLAQDLRNPPQFPDEGNPCTGDAPESASEQADHDHGLDWIELARI